MEMLMKKRMGAALALALALVATAGCQKFKLLELSKVVDLGAQEVKTPVILDPVNAPRLLAVKVECESACDAYLVIGAAEPAADRLGNGQEPKAGTFHSKLEGKGGGTSLELPANETFSLILRNPGNKPISVKVHFTSKGK
jgi:hypothetical protein